MRPFEADRRVYLIFGAHLLNAEAADALLKDLEEPPPYAVVVLVADELGPLPETIRSRCQLVPFRRLSERAVRAEVDRRAPGLSPDAGDGGRARRGRPARPRRAAARRRRRAPARRSCSPSPAPSTLDPAFDPAAAAQAVLALAAERAVEARAAGGGGARGPRAARAGGRAVREARRARRRAGGDPARARGARAPGTATSSSSPPGPSGRSSTTTGSRELAEDAGPDRGLGAERAAEAVRERGARSRSSTSRRRSRWRRCSSGCAASSAACRPRPARPDARAYGTSRVARTSVTCASPTAEGTAVIQTTM